MDSYREQLENSLGLPMANIETENSALPGTDSIKTRNYDLIQF